MSGDSVRQETYMPPAAGEGVAKVYDFMAAHQVKYGERPPAQYFLSGSEPGDQVELPQEVYELLLQVVSAMRQGLAVTIAPRSQTLTTQQAADLLGISRPTLVKLLDENRLPYERVNTHRRLLLRDVLDFREKRRRAQYEALEATSVDVAEEDDLDSVLDSLKEARRTVAERRRRRS